MVMKSTTMSAAKFKAQCLGILDKVARTRRSLVITKRGKPLARLVPLDETAQTLRGSVRLELDIVSPTSERWNAS
jgi:prevent-host-death family protein